MVSVYRKGEGGAMSNFEIVGSTLAAVSAGPLASSGSGSSPT